MRSVKARIRKTTDIKRVEYRLAAIGGTIGGLYALIVISQSSMEIYTSWGTYMNLALMPVLWFIFRVVYFPGRKLNRGLFSGPESKPPGK